MPRYRKKPVVVDAFRWDPEGDADRIPSWFYSRDCWDIINGELFIVTLNGRMKVSPGEWIIKGVKGELYPCKDDIFKATYEQVNES